MVGNIYSHITKIFICFIYSYQSLALETPTWKVKWFHLSEGVMVEDFWRLQVVSAVVRYERLSGLEKLSSVKLQESILSLKLPS